MAQQVAEKMEFPKEEEKVLQFWKDVDAFKTCLEQSKNKKKFNFYDGPPFATGKPHYGHILAGTIKDVVTRFAHQTGHHVERRFGWDCHGVPVEYIIDKKLEIKSPQQVADMGIAKYNAECRSIVMEYSGEWETTVNRLGRWIDFRNDYKTLYPWFMESVWWVFKQIFESGNVYQGTRVMPFSTGLHTPLSNFEAGQNYKEVQDPAVVVNFPMEEDPNVKLVAWTTTPWTLPSNLALCVNPDEVYVKVKCKKTGEVYILMEARLCELFKKPENYEVMGEKFLGKTLKNKKYKPLFNYFSHMKSDKADEGAFRVLCDGYVTSDSGTGVVHQAPFFGADDHRVCGEWKVFKKSEVICPVDAKGCFTEEVTDFVGQYVKDADKLINKKLKQEGRMVKDSQVKHNYPFCWRSNTPLIYKAVPTWFIKVEEHREKLLKNNANTYWVPNHVKDKRFGNWLKNAMDWGFSRNRYWGTPIPIWASEDMEEMVCVGSIEELQRLSGKTVTDIHREFVDDITIPSKRGKGQLRRISEVFDCWFESGSMPYAQQHYPFENQKQFESNFPADFIAEGIDQTRGWFYTLLVISTLLFNKPPFKNLIVNGLVLAHDGQKMSKSKKNYPDPMLVINKYGSDALRLYLVNSPVVRGDDLRFKEKGVEDIIKNVFLPWYNAYRFLIQNVLRFEKETGNKLEFSDEDTFDVENVMDKWILSYTQSLVEFVQQEMKDYKLYTVTPKLVKFIETLTNWYVRMNRNRLKSNSKDGKDALQVLFTVVFTMCKLMAPFTPFLTEHMYQNLKNMMSSYKDDKNKQSIHYLMQPDSNKNLINEEVEKSMEAMQNVVELARYIRDNKNLPQKYPAPELVVIHKDADYLRRVGSLKEYVREEVNVKEVTFTQDKKKYGAMVKAEPDHLLLGKRLKGDFRKVMKKIQGMTSADCEKVLEDGKCVIEGHEIEKNEIRFIYYLDSENDDNSQYVAKSDNKVLVLLNVKLTNEMIEEGLSREVVNRVQKLRKKASLVATDEATVYYEFVDAAGFNNDLMKKVVCNNEEKISQQTKTGVKQMPSYKLANVVTHETSDIKFEHNKADVKARLKLTLAMGKLPQSETGKPVCSFVQVNKKERCTVFLENPKNNKTVNSVDELNSLFCKHMDLNSDENKLVGCEGDVSSLAGKVLNFAGDSASTKPTDFDYVNVFSLSHRSAGCLQMVPGMNLKKEVALLFGEDENNCTLYQNESLSEGYDARKLKSKDSVYCTF